jgi:DNA-binding CsgD family transcriptional regulator
MTDPADLLQPIYDTALAPDSWPSLLATLFNCHFADVFARANDWSQFQGLAYGLDDADYQKEFLGTWTLRNVWTQRHPTRQAGEIITTPEMVARSELIRSEMFNDYLRARDLHEGLRLATWSGEGWINDISLLRSWSVGSFTAGELAMARMLLPHLQRSVALSRQVRTRADGADMGAAMLDGIEQPALLVDATGHVLRMNEAGETLARDDDGLIMRQQRISGTTQADTTRLLAAVAGAGAAEHPAAAKVVLGRHRSELPLTLSVVPVSAQVVWPIPSAGAVLVLAVRGHDPSPLSAERLQARFGLTRAEAALALQIMAGGSISSIAASSGRSLHTVRTHLARVMNKTHTHRQSELLRALVTLG